MCGSRSLLSGRLRDWSRGWLFPRGTLACALRRPSLFSHLLEILLDILLEGHRHLVAIDLAARLPVRGFALGIRRLELLLGGIHFNRHFTRHVGRSLADDLTDLAHGGELLGQFRVLRSVLLADAASGIVAGLLVRALTAALAFGRLSAVGVVARLAVL